VDSNRLPLPVLSSAHPHVLSTHKYTVIASQCAHWRGDRRECLWCNPFSPWYVGSRRTTAGIPMKLQAAGGRKKMGKNPGILPFGMPRIVPRGSEAIGFRPSPAPASAAPAAGRGASGTSCLPHAPTVPAFHPGSGVWFPWAPQGPLL